MDRPKLSAGEKSPKFSAYKCADSNPSQDGRLSVMPRLNSPNLYFDSFDSIMPCDKVYLVIRESTERQRKNLVDQATAVNAAVEKTGAMVVGIKCDVWSPKPKVDNKDWLGVVRQLFIDAVKLKANCILAESLSRYVRHPDYIPEQYWLAPNHKHFRELVKLIDEVDPGRNLRLVTLHRADLSPEEERGIQSARGMTQKGNAGGKGNKKCDAEDKPKPWMRDRKARWQPRVFELHDNGESLRSIERIVDEEMKLESECSGCLYKHIGLKVIGEWLKERRVFELPHIE